MPRRKSRQPKVEASADADVGSTDDDASPAPTSAASTRPPSFSDTGDSSASRPPSEAGKPLGVTVNTSVVLVTTAAGTFTVTLHLPPAVVRSAKPLLLLLHGFPDLPEPSFAAVARRFTAAGYGVAIPHLRGYESPTVQKGCTRTEYFPCDLGVDVLELIAALKARNYCHPDVGVVLVGHDWGSIAAQAAAALLYESHYEDVAANEQQHGRDGAEGNDNAERLRRARVLPKSILRGLVLLSVPPAQLFIKAATWLYPAQLLYSWYMIFFQLPWLPELALRKTRLIERLWRKWSPDMSRIEAGRRAEAVRAHLIANGRPTRETRPDHSLHLNGSDAPLVSSSAAARSSHGSCLVAALAYYRCMFNVFHAKGRYSVYLALSNSVEFLAARALPTLAINGVHDGAIHPQVFAYCAKHVRHLHGNGVPHVQIDGAGHWPHIEQPDMTADAILAFFEKRGLSAPPAPPKSKSKSAPR
jgi:pimeloyl-ACP methyl ester carboxylesterase